MAQHAGASGATQTRLGERHVRLASPATATALAATILLLTVALVPLSLLARQGAASNVGQIVPFLPLAAVGWLVAQRQRGESSLPSGNSRITGGSVTYRVR